MPSTSFTLEGNEMNVNQIFKRVYGILDPKKLFETLVRSNMMPNAIFGKVYSKNKEAFGKQIMEGTF